MNLKKYQAASSPRIGNSWFTAIADFINQRFTLETSFNVDEISESTADEGVTVENVLIKDGMITSGLSATSGFPMWNGVDPSDWILFNDDFITPAIDDIANGSMGYEVVTDAIGTTALVTPYVNGVAGTVHEIKISGFEEMHIIAGVKSGDTNEETLLVDYIAVAQERR